MKILVTGCCGFIGSHLSEFLLKKDIIVVGVDIMNDYYSESIKEKNLKLLSGYDNFKFYKEDVCESKVISLEKPDKVCHLASVAGVRSSIKNPKMYETVNIGGFINILEECVKNEVKQLVYASSSSVYGLNKKLPFSENDIINTCNSPYACTKLSMEIFAKTYYQLYKLENIGLRFFTVYGPRGRPDMAPYIFIKKIKDGEEISMYGDGENSRDYTYVSDIIDGIWGALVRGKGCEIYNLGGNNPIKLKDFIEECEKVVGKKAIIAKRVEQLGDVPHTHANIEKAKRDLGYKPKIEIETGLRNLYFHLYPQ